MQKKSDLQAGQLVCHQIRLEPEPALASVPSEPVNMQGIPGALQVIAGKRLRLVLTSLSLLYNAEGARRLSTMAKRWGTDFSVGSTDRHPPAHGDFACKRTKSFRFEALHKISSMMPGAPNLFLMLTGQTCYSPPRRPPPCGQLLAHQGDSPTEITSEDQARRSLQSKDKADKEAADEAVAMEMSETAISISFCARVEPPYVQEVHRSACAVF